MTTFMLYAMLIGVFTAAAGWAAEWIGRAFGTPVRWTWAAALGVTVLLAAAAPRRSLSSAVDVTLGPVVERTAPSVSPVVHTTLFATLRATCASAIDASARTFTVALARLETRTSPRMNVAAVVLWVSLTALVLAMLATVTRRMRVARRRWTVATVGGESVRVSTAVGPVVLGYVRPEIVVPAWLLERTEAEQRMVVAHEAEHVRARDPLLLGAACVAAALMPWNPAVWFMFTRLRLAVELDCDARLLRRGAAAHAYGALLIDVAERVAPLRLAALALADDSSHLHQRILAMKAHTPKFAIVRGGVAAALGFVALLAACEAKLPTQADVAKMDGASTERALVASQMVGGRDSIKYYIDGKLASAIQAHALAGDTIATVDVRRTPGGGFDTIYFKTLSSSAYREKMVTDSVARVAAGITGRVRVSGRGVPGSAATEGGSGDAIKVLGASANEKKVPIYIDGVLADMATLQRLHLNDIESIEVIKGAAAAEQNPDVPGAAQGIIKVRTKHGSK